MCSGEGPWILWVILSKSASGDEPPGPTMSIKLYIFELLIGNHGFGPIPLVGGAGGILFLSLLVLCFFNGSPDVGRLSSLMTSIDSCGWNKVSRPVPHPLYPRATLPLHLHEYYSSLNILAVHLQSWLPHKLYTLILLSPLPISPTTPYHWQSVSPWSQQVLWELHSCGQGI